MNLAAVFNQVATANGSSGRWEQCTPLQREAVEVMAAVVEAGNRDPEAIAKAVMGHLQATYDLAPSEGAAETYLLLAQGLLKARWDLPSSPWADALPVAFPTDRPTTGAWLIPEDDYHADPLKRGGGSANASTLKRLLPPGSPALVQWDRANPPQRDCWDLGAVTHTMTLGTGPEIVEVQHSDWRTKDAKEQREWARERGAVALLSKDLDTCSEMAAAVRAHPLAGGLLRIPGASEVTLTWRERVPGTDRWVWGRGMVDRHPDPAHVAILGDVKTAAGDLDEDWIRRRCWDLGYYQAADWYGRGYLAVHGQPLEAFWLLFVRSVPPHLVHVVELDQDLIERGHERNDTALRVWDECQRTGVWPGPGSDTEPTLIGAPGWVR